MLRQQIRRRILALPTSIKEEKEKNISSRLFNLVSHICSEKLFTRLGVFSPLSDEPVWWESFNNDLQWLAVHMEDDSQLGFYEVSPSEYRKSRGVLQLEDRDPKTLNSPEVILVPGIGFSRTGDRLGRGKGYYDRYLEKFSGISIGVFFAESECENVLAEGHDMKLDFIVTDKELINLKNKY